jgi:hypothetical protein
MYSIFDGYYYSRPVSYRSYYPRVQKPFILTDHLDKESDAIRNILARNKQEFNQTDSLARGIHWTDYVFGKRHFNHHSHETEWYIHEWKSTNDLQAEHPTGTARIYHNFEEFARDVEKLVSTPPNRLKL